MSSLTLDQRQLLQCTPEAPDDVLPYRQPGDAAFSTDTLTELTRLGVIHRSHRGFGLTTTGREALQPHRRPATRRGIAHRFSRG